MKMLIIPSDRVQKLQDMEFDGYNRLDPVRGEMNGQEVYFLQADLKENKTFAKALNDFEASEIKEIETIEDKYFDSKNVEIKAIGGEYKDLKGKVLDVMTLNRKTVLTIKK